jgi:flagellar basal-body rod protein FlgB
MIEKLQRAFQFEEHALRLRSTRQQVLSENIANDVTPGYKARDMDFASALSAKMGVSDSLSMTDSFSASTTQSTDANHIQSSMDTGIGDNSLQYRVPYQSSVDGNTVEVESEKARAAENAMHYMNVTNALQQKFSWWSRFLQDKS